MFDLRTLLVKKPFTYPFANYGYMVTLGQINFWLFKVRTIYEFYDFNNL